MKYEIVYLEEKVVAGLKIRTNNNDPNMTKSISGAWKKFYEGGIYNSILNKKNSNSIGLYTNYENNVNGDYDVMICCEILKEEELSSDVEVMKISKGKYAKFAVKGNVHEAVASCWTEIWSMNLDRKYTFDFEEYKAGNDIENAEIDIFISIN